jgi:FtsX-like permease family
VKQVWRVVWYRSRVTLGRRWGGLLAVAVLVGVLGGLAMGAIAGARRTQSSFPALMARTNASDLTVISAVLNPQIGGTSGYNPDLLRAIARVPHVTHIASESGLDVLPLAPNGAPLNFADLTPQAGAGLGSDDGEGFSQDRALVREGRAADPSRADEIVMPVVVARDARLHVGDHVSLGVYTNAQTQLPAFGTAKVQPYRRVDVTLVGTFVQGSQLVEDDVDNSTSLALFTPAFTRPLLECCANYTGTGIQVDGGPHEISAVAAQLDRLLPNGFPAPASTSLVGAKAERAIKPESIALGVFGGIAALAALVIAAQAIARHLRLGADDAHILRALGAGPTMTWSDGLIGILGAIAAGSVLAFGVAVLISPLAPVGPVRPVDPSPGVSFDWTVLGIGVAVLVVSLSALSLVFAATQTRRHAATRYQRRRNRQSSPARLAAASGMAPPVVIGVRFALDPGVGRNTVPVRSAIGGTALAVMVLVSTVTFGASLRALVSHPALYGWNWNYALSAGGGSGDIPQQQATRLLNQDPYLQAWSGAYAADLRIDGQTIPVLGEAPAAPVQPAILSGHQLDARDQVVLGAITLNQLHKHVGDTVTVSNAATGTVQLQIVGTATMPTIGGAGGPHLEMGVGALVADTLLPAAARNPFDDPVAGPENIFVRVRPGSSTAALHSLQQMTTPLSNNFNFGVFVGLVLRPAEIVNYRSMNATPALLGGALAAGATVALVLTLITAVRRRRRDLALLKTIGFTRRQLGAVVAAQSTVAIAIGTIIGVPAGIIAGRWLWKLFANEIHVIPTPTIPTSTIALIAVGALVLANLVAAIPGLQAARTRTAVLLHSE